MSYKGVVSTLLNKRQKLKGKKNMAFAILRAAKLKTMGNIGGSLAHNYRTIETPNADPSQTANNFHSLKNPNAVKNAISERLPEKRRSDAVLCVEYMITASPEWQGWNDERQIEYFKQAVDWLEQRHGKHNVVATSIHRDETTPHLVAYVVPLDQETGKLNAKKFLGGKAKLAEMQSSFSEHVKNLGLERGIEGSKAKHTRIKEYYAKVNEPAPKLKPIDRPKAGLFETTTQYGNKVVDSVLEQIKPQWESMAELTKEVKTARKELLDARKSLLELQDKVKPYLDAIRPLGARERRFLNQTIEQASKELLSKSLEEEKQYQARKEQAHIEKWEKTYSGLTEQQKVHLESYFMVMNEKLKGDPSLLKQRIRETQDKIIKNPGVLDAVELPTVKTQQDIYISTKKIEKDRYM